MTWPRAELEAAFVEYQRRVEVGDWSAWADLFTEDAEYVEHEFGTMRGREEIRNWIVETMGAVSGMSFPVEWVVFDEERGRVIEYTWNTFDPLPGDDGVYRFGVVTILTYCGDGQWSRQEDVYNAKEAETVLGAFLEAAARHGVDVPAGPDRA